PPGGEEPSFGGTRQESLSALLGFGGANRDPAGPIDHGFHQGESQGREPDGAGPAVRTHATVSHALARAVRPGTSVGASQLLSPRRARLQPARKVPGRAIRLPGVSTQERQDTVISLPRDQQFGRRRGAANRGSRSWFLWSNFRK